MPTKMTHMVRSGFGGLSEFPLALNSLKLALSLSTFSMSCHEALQFILGRRGDPELIILTHR